MGRSLSNSFLTVMLLKVAAAVLILAAVLMAQPANTILEEKWDNITGGTVASLTSNAAYPNSPTTRTYPTLYEIPSTAGDNYGTRTRGYVTPPTTGSYTFWIACDDNCELWLGTSTDPATATKIAGVTGTNWTNPREWTKFTEQQSAVKTLTGGTKYYIETRHKEGSGGDCMAVGWQGPGITADAERPIPGTRLSPFLLPGSPAITTQPANQTVNVGQTATFTVVASGNATLTYQWRKGGTNISGATSASYTTPATVAGDNGALFSVVVTNSLGNVTSANAVLTVNTLPTITTQPANQAVTVPQTATFTVVAAGSGTLTYQWRKGGTNIAGATSASYTTPATVAADNGAAFSVVVTNSSGSVTSANATLTCNLPPSITTQPADQTVTAGATATFSVVATGTATLTYQWSKGGVPITGATAASYTTPVTVSGDNGAQFSVVVTNPYGTLTSTRGTLTVNTPSTPPSITTQPVSTTVTIPATATVSVVAAGTAPLAYQWRKAGANIAGATASSYTTPATVAGDDGSAYSVVVTNAFGTVTSSNATLTCITPPSIITQPANQTVNPGQTATFSVAASGTAPLSYQWKKGGVNISGATAASYTTPATVVGDNGSQYSVAVSNAGSTVTSGNATLTVNLPPTITTPPANQTVAVGQTATFSVVATGTAPLSYQWLRGGTTIAGATAASYTTPAAVAGDNGTLYSVTVGNMVSSVTSPTATLSVNTPPSITTQPANQTVNLGQTATFTVVATGTAPLTYQWKKNGANISGATSASYTTPATVSGDNGATFSVVVSNLAASTTSNTATLTVGGAPVILPIDPPGPVQPNVPVTPCVSASGATPLTYQWRKNGANIPGATSACYTTPPLSLADNGSAFNVVVANPLGSTTSATFTIAVLAPIVITTPPADQIGQIGGSVTFSVVVTGGNPTYQWNKAVPGTTFAPIPGATASSYTTPALTSGDNGTQYNVTVNSPLNNPVTSPAATLTVATPITITAQPQDLVVAETQTATFSVAAHSTQTMTYQWKKNGNPIANAIAAAYTTPMTGQNDNDAIFTCVVSGPGGSSSATSNPARLQVVGTKFNTGLVNGSAPVLDVSSVYGNGSSGLRSGMKINSANGSNSTGDAISLSVSTAAGAGNSGTVTAENIAATEGPGSSADLTGLNVNVTKEPTSTNSTAYGLKVNMNALPDAKAYSAVFSGGNVGIGTLTPSEALEVAGNLKVGAAMLGRQIELGASFGDPDGWQFKMDEPYGNLYLVRGNDFNVFKVYSAYNSTNSHLEINGFFTLAGEDLHQDGYTTNFYDNFDYMYGISQTKSVYLDQTGQSPDFYYSLLDSKKLYLEENSPYDGTSKLLSATSEVNHATVSLEKKWSIGDSPDLVTDYTMVASPYAINLDLWEADVLLSSSSMNTDGFSTNRRMVFRGDDYQDGDESTSMETIINREEGIGNSWLKTYQDGSHRSNDSHLDNGSLSIVEERDIYNPEDGSTSTVDYHNGAYLNTQGMCFLQYSTQKPDGEFRFKTEADLKNGVLELEYADPDDLTNRHMEVGIWGLRFTTTEFGNEMATTEINGEGITTTALHATSVVTTPTWRIPDYVFEKHYQLQSLESVGKYVEANKHLPNIPSAQEIKDKGMDLTEMNVKLLEKVEELTLHMIAMDKELKKQKKTNNHLEKTVRKLQSKVKED